MWLAMAQITEEPTASHFVAEGPTGVLELADGTCLEPDAGRDRRPSRLTGERDRAFNLRDALDGGGEPFAGYHVRRDG